MHDGYLPRLRYMRRHDADRREKTMLRSYRIKANIQTDKPRL